MQKSGRKFAVSCENPTGSDKIEIPLGLQSKRLRSRWTVLENVADFCVFVSRAESWISIDGEDVYSNQLRANLKMDVLYIFCSMSGQPAFLAIIHAISLLLLGLHFIFFSANKT